VQSCDPVGLSGVEFGGLLYTFCMDAILQSSSGMRVVRRLLLIGVACLCLPVDSWSDPGAETTESLLQLDGEVQSIKSESLAISLQLPGDYSSLDIEGLERLLARDPADVSSLDYLRAIGYLERREANEPIENDTRLLLARLKLAYGLHLEAGYDLHAVADGVPVSEQDRAWYELAKAFYGKGYHQAALEALTRIRADMPPELLGGYQLLHANVLMSLGRDAEAVGVLSPWRGGKALEAYGHYNLGIALLRTGEEAGAVASMEKATRVRAGDEETANLRDRARLSLGYLLARQGDYRRARRNLEAVSDPGPFANRAVIALGWIAHQRGKPDEALESWSTLRGGSTTDPDVLETLILVPALHSEADNHESAYLEYESAMATYRRELDQLDSVRYRLSSDDTATGLLDGSEVQADSQLKALLGPLLASRQLEAMRRDRDDLMALLGALEQELRDVETVAGSGRSSRALLPDVEVQRAGPAGGASAADREVDRSPRAPAATPDMPAAKDVDPAPSLAYQLPEIESPPERKVKPFPESGSTERSPSRFRGMPQSPEWIKEPPDPRITGMPDSEIIWLPSSGEFFRRPGEADLEDYEYPDERPGGMAKADSLDFLPGPETASSFDSGTRPVGDALKELALALQGDGTGRPAAESFDPLSQGAERERQIAALRQRILVLKERIGLVAREYENHARGLALAELERRQRFIEDLQEQASLELAKTYDRRSQQ
jgi:hypothetical protein